MGARLGALLCWLRFGLQKDTPAGPGTRKVSKGVFPQQVLKTQSRVSPTPTLSSFCKTQMQSGYGWSKTPPSSRSSRYLPGEVKSPFWELKVCVERVLRIWGEKDESMAEREHEGAAAPDIPIVSLFLRPLCQPRILEQLSASLQALPLSLYEN